MKKNAITEIAERWRREADRYERDDALVRGDAVLRRVADELEAAWREWQDEVRSVADASAESGYGEEQLRRLIRDGTIPNAGKPYSPLIRRRDLPRKPGHSGNGGLTQNVVDYSSYTKSDGGKRTADYDPEEDARSIAEQLGRQ